WLPFAAVSIRQQFGTQMPQRGHPPHHSITSSARPSSGSGTGDAERLGGFEVQVLSSQLAQGPDFLAGEWVRAIDTVFCPPHMDAAAIKLDHIPGQFAEFAGA